MFRFLPFFLLLFLIYFCFPKHKKTKNISVVSLWLSLWFFVFGLLNLLVSLLFENQKKNYFLCFVLAFQKSKTQKYFVFFFGFVKFSQSSAVQGCSIGVW